jgi:4,5-dihydroxyphthalate decarboxylase
MAALRLSISCGYYDRTLPLLDGRVKAEGIELAFDARPGVTIGAQEADVYETPLPSLIIERERSDRHRGIAVFPRRKFFHQLLLVGRDSPLRDLGDLRGKRIGLLRWYQHALGVWLRGHLKERWGIDAGEMEWFTERPDLVPLAAGKRVAVAIVPPERSLADMLVAGEIDVLLHEDARRILMTHGRALRRLFPQAKEAEAGYFHETGIFPINHVLAIKSEIVARRPWIAGRIVCAFEEAKRLALDELDRDTSFVSSPWMAPLLEDQERLLKRDLYPYGLEPNRAALEAIVRYLVEQGLISAPMALGEIFAAEG